MDVSFDVTRREGTTIVAIRGEMDAYTSPRLRDRFVELSDSGTNFVVVDLERLGFLDSAGLGVLVGGLKRFRSAGGDLVVVCTHPRILKVLEITGLTAVFSIHDSVDGAVSAQRT